MVVIQIKPHGSDRPWYLSEMIRFVAEHHEVEYIDTLSIDEAKLFHSEKEARQFVKDCKIKDVLCYMEVDPIEMINKLRYKVERFRRTVNEAADNLNAWRY